MLQEQDVIVLEHTVELFIPTQCICGKDIDLGLRNEILTYVKGRFYDWFGGATVKPVNGIWKLPDESIADEKVDIIESLASDEAYDDHLHNVKKLAVEVADKLSQDRVLIKINGKGFLYARSNTQAKCHHNKETKPSSSHPVPDAKDLVVSIYYSLAKFSSLRDARNLFCNVLNYKMVVSGVPSYDRWPSNIQSLLKESPEIIADANGFKIIHLHLAADCLRCGTERQIIQRFYQDDPSFCGFFVVSNATQKEWEFVSSKNQGDGSKKILFRRMRVGNDSVRTATERIALIQIAEDEEKTISSAEVQSRHDKAFDVGAVTKQFYRELSDWYFWALSLVKFPNDLEKGEETNTAENTIRLITRLIFVWFLKEKGLVPSVIFDSKVLDKMIDCSKDKTGSAYYRAILQNLFFATLNVPMSEREFRTERRFQGKNEDYMNHRVYRYAELFRDANPFGRIFKDIPFLNGGLFECLDYRDENGKEVRIDCFSDNPKNATRLVVPDVLFFGDDVVDLSEVYQDQHRSHVNVRGIITILNSYNFTLEENTPLEEEIALDPELLGRVFENLLASYNPETRSTARKQTGSFYTPREIVSYMVDESLKAYLATELGEDSATKEKLEKVLDYTDELPELTEIETDHIIAALENARILDPACGSGAFPMGILQKMVHVLKKLDPLNEKWKRAILKRTPSEIRAETAKMLASNTADYIRKLGIIQNCIYGVDIQPIAIQVSKLRFFISLLVDFTVDKGKENYGIQPLPNLDYKLMQGNSLIEDFHGFTLQLKDRGSERESQDLFGRDEEVDQLIEDLWEKQGDYLRESRHRRRIKLQEEVEKDIVHIFHTYVRHKKTAYFADLKSLEDRIKPIPNEKTKTEYRTRELAKLNRKHSFNHLALEAELRELTHGYKLRNFFPWQLYFADVFKNRGGFDIVIGNPPYVRADANAEMLAQRQRIIETKRYQTLYEKWDLFIPFIELGFSLLKENGITSMIVSDAYCHAKYAKKSQEWFLQNSRILRLDFLSKIKVFEAAVHNIIYFFQKTDGIYNLPLRRVHTDEFGKITLLRTSEQRSLTNRAFFPEDSNIISTSVKCVLLADICYISKGMVVHADDKKSKGLFEMKDLVSDSKDRLHPKPFVEGKHLDRWIPMSNKWLEWGTNRAPKLFSRPTFEALYKVSHKLISVDMAASSPRLRVTYDDSNLYHNHSAWSFVQWHLLSGIRNNSLKKAARYLNEPKRSDLPRREELEKISNRFSIKFLIGVMNSFFAYEFLRANRRSNIHLYPDDWKRLPIPDVSREKQKPVITLVDQIIAAKKENVNADVSLIEKQLDEVVTGLYTNV